MPLFEKSDNIDSDAALRNAIIEGVQHIEASMIPRISDPRENVIQSFLVPGISQPFYILENKSLRTGLVKQAKGIVPKLPAVIIKTQIPPRYRPALTRDAPHQQVMPRQLFKLCDVAKISSGAGRMVVDVRPDSVRVDFGKADTSSAAPLNGKTETADPGKQIYSRKTHQILSLPQHRHTSIRRRFHSQELPVNAFTVLFAQRVDLPDEGLIRPLTPNHVPKLIPDEHRRIASHIEPA